MDCLFKGPCSELKQGSYPLVDDFHESRLKGRRTKGSLISLWFPCHFLFFVDPVE